MTKTVLWIVGEPGVGKTTLARAFLEGHGRQTWEHESPKWTGFGEDVAAAGWWRGGMFDGADTLSISQIKPAMSFWADRSDIRLAILDGDKLANAGAVQLAFGCGARLVCAYLRGAGHATTRRALRGTNQCATWVKGRGTKAANFAAGFPGNTITIPAWFPIPLAIARLRKAVA